MVIDKEEYKRCQDMVTNKEAYKITNKEAYKMSIKTHNESIQKMSNKKHTLWFKLLSLKRKDGGNAK